MSMEITHNYESVDQSLSTDDITVATILTDIKNTVIESNDKAPSSVKTTAPIIHSDYPLDPTSLSCHSLLDLAKKHINTRDLQKKYELSIDAKHIYYIQLIIQKHPEFFDSFESSLKLIINDGKVSFSDMPELVKMMMKLYEILHRFKPQNITYICVCIMKILCFICLKEQVVKVENKTDILIAFNNLIDSIEDLLKMHIQLNNCCNYITCNLTGWCFN